jgi:hypothetical protein
VKIFIKKNRITLNQKRILDLHLSKTFLKKRKLTLKQLKYQIILKLRKVNIKYLNNKVKAKIKNKAILDFTR